MYLTSLSLAKRSNLHEYLASVRSAEISPRNAASDTQDRKCFSNTTEANKTQVTPRKTYEALTITLNYNLSLQFCELLFDSSPFKWHLKKKKNMYKFQFNCEWTKGARSWVFSMYEVAFPVTQRGWKEHLLYATLLINS